MTAVDIDAVAAIRQRTVPLIDELVPLVCRVANAVDEWEKIETAVTVVSPDDGDLDGKAWLNLRRETGAEAVSDLLRHVGYLIEQGLNGSGFVPIDGVGRYFSPERLLSALDLEPPEGLNRA